ncbi:PREDICTED: uncharacterized protein LOC101311563 [Fragaria vesca subsp. vesca]
MVAKQCVRFLEALHNMVCDSAHGLSTETKFVDALAKYDLKWKKYISAGTVEEAVMNFRKGYVGTAVDLPKFTHSCVKHYKETAKKMNQKELTQLEVIEKLRSIQGFECVPEDLFKALYKGAVSLANNVQRLLTITHQRRS